jgi:hypothetical protein
MPLVVADTSPVFYLLSIGQIDLLPLIFGRILVPEAVYRELSHPTAPEILRRWTAEPPDWLEVKPVDSADDAALLTLGAGERAAIAGDMRDFRGAMMGRADEGLFITTGTFTPAAVKEATRDGAPPIDLLDGNDFAEKLRELGIGVSTKTVEVYSVDEAWFANT